jgi:DNA-binding CsgD family transcriptional regulator
VSAETPRGNQAMPRPTILTKAALDRVTRLVNQGRSAAEIADELGCTLGTLRVRCSQHRISLRRRTGGNFDETFTPMDLVAGPDANPRSKSGDRGYGVEHGRPIVREASTQVHIELKVMLPRITAEQLRQRGALRGISSSTLAEKLLVTIGRDCLYDALLDGG